MERYLLTNNKYFVLAGSCNESDSETEYEVPKDWNDTDSKYFLSLLELTNVQAIGDKHIRVPTTPTTPGTERLSLNKVDIETFEMNSQPDWSPKVTHERKGRLTTKSMKTATSIETGDTKQIEK